MVMQVGSLAFTIHIIEYLVYENVRDFFKARLIIRWWNIDTDDWKSNVLQSLNGEEVTETIEGTGHTEADALRQMWRKHALSGFPRPVKEQLIPIERFYSY